MGQAVTIEITFVATRPGPDHDRVPAEGVIRMPDDALRPFSGWIDLLAALEDVVVRTAR
jgi:hypothetical protein